MNECKKCELLFEKALYGELNLTQKEFFSSHLDSCKNCLANFNELKDTLNAANQYIRPEPDDNFMNNLWETLEPKLPKKKQSLLSRWSDFINSVRFHFSWKQSLAGGIAILIIGIFIGKYLSDNGKTNRELSIPIENETDLRQTALNIEAANYIERSKILLLGIMNFDPSTDDIESISLPQQKQISRELLSQASELETNLKDPSQQQLKRLVADIGLILLQIANLDSKQELTGIELVKQGVNSKAIILKINIHEINAGGKENYRRDKPTKNGNKKI